MNVLLGIWIPYFKASSYGAFRKSLYCTLQIILFFWKLKRLQLQRAINIKLYESTIKLFLILRKGGSNMISIYKSLIVAVVIGLYVYIASKSENSVLLNFVILYIIISIVYLLFRKIEKEKSKEK